MADRWGSALAEYSTFMMAADRARGTIRLQVWHLRSFAEQCGDPWAVTTSDLQQFLARPTWKTETRKSARSTLRSFYAWALDADLISSNPALRLRPIRVPHGVPRPISDDMLRAALRDAEPRERLMMALAAFAGLRAAEISQVHRDDVVDGTLRVTGKGGRTRVIPLVPELAGSLELVDGWAFPNRWNDQPLTPGCVTRLVSRALPAGWTAHTLRHRFATSAYEGCRDLLAVGALLGHSRPETTQRYTRLPDDALRRAVSSVSLVDGQTAPSSSTTPRDTRDALLVGLAAAGWAEVREAVARTGISMFGLADLLLAGTVRHAWVQVDPMTSNADLPPIGVHVVRTADLPAPRPHRARLRAVRASQGPDPT